MLGNNLFQNDLLKMLSKVWLRVDELIDNWLRSATAGFLCFLSTRSQLTVVYSGYTGKLQESQIMFHVPP